jgi:O-antigen ligase
MKKKLPIRFKSVTSDLPIIASLIVAMLLMLPGLAYDPTNLPRLVFIALTSAWILPQLVRLLVQRFKSKSKSLDEQILLTLIVCYFCWAVISSMFNETPAVQELLGDFGRSTGMVAYFSLLILFLWSTYSTGYVEKSSLENTFRTLFHITNIYLLLQYFGLDPVEWENPYGVTIIGTMGNPNFSSMASALCALFFSSNIIFKKSKVNATKFTDGIGLLLSSALTIVNPSSQGIIALSLGLILQLTLKTPRRIRMILMSSLAGLGLLILGLLISFIVSEKYLSIPILSENLVFRLLAWNASWGIIIDYPIFGTGFDSLGSWFTQYRDSRISQGYLDHAYADATHNVFLDQGVNGGIPLFALYIAIFLTISWQAIRHLLITNTIQAEFAFLAPAWLGFLFFQLVSINQLGIATLGFIIGGLLIGNTRASKLPSIEKVRMRGIISLSVLIAVTLVPIQALKKDIEYLSAISSGDGSLLISAASMWPQSDFYFARTADILYNNGYDKLGRIEAEKALKLNSRNIIALKLLVKDPYLSSERGAFLLQRLKVLDPLGYRAIQSKN